MHLATGRFVHFIQCICLVILCSISVINAGEYTVSSPDESIVVTINESPNFRFMITKDGNTALEWSPLGVTASSMNFTTGIQFVSQQENVIDEEYPAVHGTKSVHKNHCNELDLTLRNAANNQFHLVFRVFNEGAAFRYIISGTGNATITSEATTFIVPNGCTAWLGTWDTNNEYQGYWRVNNSTNNTAIQFPALLKTPDDIYVQLTEAATYGAFCASRLSASTTRFEVVLGESQVAVSLPLTMPWRVIMVGTLKNIFENTRQTVDNLNPPCELQDVSWIKSGRSAWSWLAELSVRDYAQQKRYIDFAKEMAWEYCLVDEGWRNSNMPQLSQYAESQGIGLILWFNFSEMQNATAINNIITQCKSYGIKGMKVDFPQSDRKQRMVWYDDITQAAAEAELMIYFHGCTIPRGQERRWPHIMTYEAIRGAEQYLGGPTGVNIVHNCIVPYTRNAIGTMDYTPVVYSRTRHTTDAHELAQTVVYQSSIQHFGDSPEAFKAVTPSPLPFMQAVPASWDDEEFLDGEPGEFICVARRSGNDWFVAGINGEEARDVTLDLSFLKSGTYTVDRYSDVRANSQDMQMEEETITIPGTHTVRMERGGGFCFYAADSYDDNPTKIDRKSSLTNATAPRTRSLAVTHCGEQIHVRVRGFASPQIKIINCLGQAILSGDGSLYAIPATAIQPGMYVVQVTGTGYSLTKKFVNR